MRRTVRVVVATALIGVTVGAAAVSASPASAAVAPPLSVPTATIRAAVTCHGDLAAAATPTPVLLVPGTTLTAAVNFSWNYEKKFTADKRPWCAVELPNSGMSDIQIAGEYVVGAIRLMHERAHRVISVVGFSQGGMVPRWALKYWPDTRAMVDDVIGIDPSNHGTLDTQVICGLGGCAPSLWQQRSGSAFLTALNKGGETFAGISYTQVYSAFDEIVVPNAGPDASSALHTGAGRISNLLVQDVCPLHLAEHLIMGTYDPVGYAAVLDALDHVGPVDASRISTSVCLQPTIPGLDPLSVATNFARTVLAAGQQFLLYPHVPTEPALKAYATR